jgi:hypothetical protein
MSHHIAAVRRAGEVLSCNKLEALHVLLLPLPCWSRIGNLFLFFFAPGIYYVVALMTIRWT